MRSVDPDVGASTPEAPTTRGRRPPNKMIMASLIFAALGAALGLFALGIAQGWWGHVPQPPESGDPSERDTGEALE